MPKKIDNDKKMKNETKHKSDASRSPTPPSRSPSPKRKDVAVEASDSHGHGPVTVLSTAVPIDASMFNSKCAFVGSGCIGWWKQRWCGSSKCFVSPLANVCDEREENVCCCQDQEMENEEDKMKNGEEDRKSQPCPCSCTKRPCKKGRLLDSKEYKELHAKLLGKFNVPSNFGVKMRKSYQVRRREPLTKEQLYIMEKRLMYRPDWDSDARPSPPEPFDSLGMTEAKLELLHMAGMSNVEGIHLLNDLGVGVELKFKAPLHHQLFSKSHKTFQILNKK